MNAGTMSGMEENFFPTNLKLIMSLEVVFLINYF